MEPEESNKPAMPEQPKAGDQPTGAEDEAPTMAAPLKLARKFNVGEVVLGRYKITGELGKGGMGVVYRCQDTIGGIDIALKTLPPDVSRDENEMADVRANFQLVSRLSHPNIAAIRTLERDPESGNYFLVLECVEGMDLLKWRKQLQGGSRKLQEILPVLQQVAGALDYAHSQKIIHRDIKPANVMICKDGTAKILDFGLAAQIHSSMSRVTRMVGGTSGTAPYMAPEQWRGLHQGAETDQYALAVMAYELLAGHRPFENHDMGVLMQMVINEPPAQIAGLERRAWEALQRGMAKKPEGRFASCAEMIAALSGEVGRNAVTKHMNIAPASATAGAGKWIALAAAGIALLASAGFLAWRSSQQNAEKAAAAAQAKAAETQQQARQFTELTTRAAQTAVESGDLRKAGELAAQIEKTDANAAQTVRVEIETKSTERDATKKYGEASVAHDRLTGNKPDRGQGLGPRLDQLEANWRSAEAARAAKSWSDAVGGYDAVIALAKDIETFDGERAKAMTARSQTDAARTEAEKAEAKTLAAAEWTEAEKIRTQADQAFEAGTFDVASVKFADAQAKTAAALAAAQIAKKNMPAVEVSKGPPKFLVILPEQVDGVWYWNYFTTESQHIVQSAVEKSFVDAGLEVIDLSTLKMKNDGSVESLLSPAAAAAAGKEAGAAYVIVGNATAVHGGTSVAYGITVVRMAASMTAKIVRASDGKVLAVKEAEANEGGQGSRAAGQAALKKAVPDLASDLVSAAKKIALGD